MRKDLTHVAMMPQARAAKTLSKLIEPVASADTGEVVLADINDIMLELLNETKKLRRNNLHKSEDMLAAQMQVLDALFHKFVGDALKTRHLEQIKTMLLLALKSQSQCRSTAETLSEIKNPRPVFQQNNMAHNQQVNNRIAAPAHGKKEKPTNELLTDRRNEHETLDFRRAKAAVGADTELEAVELVYGAENGRR
ncbi:MAG: hypothetical protein R3E13_05780 [Alphaproteobacteria bacterium]